MGQNARTRITFSALAWAMSLLGLLCFTVLPVARAQTKPAAPGAPPVTVSVIEVSPRALPLYTEYTGTTDALETVEIRARVDGFIEQKLFNGGQVIKAGERLYLLDQRTFIAELQKAKAAVAKAEADLRYAKEGVEVFRAESRLAQSRAALVKAEQDVARYRPLVTAGGGPQQDLDAAVAQRKCQGRSGARKAELTRPNSTADADRAGCCRTGMRHGPRCAWQSLNLDYTEIRAPVNGRIGESNIFVGGLATKNSAQAPDPALAAGSDPGEGQDRGARIPQLHPKESATAEERGRAGIGPRLSAPAGGWQHLSLPRPLPVGGSRRGPADRHPGNHPGFPQSRRLRCCRAPSAASEVQTGEKSGVFLVPQRAIRELQGVRSRVSGRQGRYGRDTHGHGRRASGGISGSSRKAWRRAIGSSWKGSSGCSPA